MAIVRRDREVAKPRGGLLKFTEWKQATLEKMLQDEELMKLLIYHTEDWDSKPAVRSEQREGLIGHQIFTHSFIDELAKEKKSYIGVSLSHFAKDEGFRRFSNRYIMGYLYFHILVDLGIMETNTGSRADLILGRIYEIFQDNTTLGMGEMKVETVIERWHDKGTHGGYVMGFRLTDLD
ncbi:TPA: hypothetical protein ACGO1T_000531 [Streptococcus suis]